MKQYTQEELHTILKNHKHWRLQDCAGWEDMRADLSDTNLSGINLIDADLRDVNLSNANLCHATLIDVDLSYANLIGADLSYAILRKANVHYANLSYAKLISVDLSRANLNNTNLRHTVLRDVDLSDADLRGADLRNSDLSGADLSKAILSGADFRGTKNTPFIPQTCPEEGSFIGYKKASGCIVKLEILADARRCSATGRQCRCDKAKILDIQNLNLDEPCELTEVKSSHNSSFIYRVGEIVEEPEFDENRWHECSKGIHFFISRQEAVTY